VKRIYNRQISPVCKKQEAEHKRSLLIKLNEVNLQHLMMFTCAVHHFGELSLNDNVSLARYILALKID